MMFARTPEARRIRTLLRAGRPIEALAFAACTDLVADPIIEAGNIAITAPAPFGADDIVRALSRLYRLTERQ